MNDRLGGFTFDICLCRREQNKIVRNINSMPARLQQIARVELLNAEKLPRRREELRDEFSRILVDDDNHDNRAQLGQHAQSA